MRIKNHPYRRVEAINKTNKLTNEEKWIEILKKEEMISKYQSLITNKGKNIDKYI